MKTTDQECADPDSGEEDFRWQATKGPPKGDEDKMSQPFDEVITHGN